jgi:hypothetical protein
MYAQDHDEQLPEAAAVWSSLDLDRKLTVCPTAGTKQPKAYGFNADLSGLAQGDIESPVKTVMLADALVPSSTNNVLYSTADIDTRHAKQVIVAGADGHVQLVKPVNGDLGEGLIAAGFWNLFAPWKVGLKMRKDPFVTAKVTVGSGCAQHYSDFTRFGAAGYWRCDGKSKRPAWAEALTVKSYLAAVETAAVGTTDTYNGNHYLGASDESRWYQHITTTVDGVKSQSNKCTGRNSVSHDGYECALILNDTRLHAVIPLVATHWDSGGPFTVTCTITEDGVPANTATTNASYMWDPTYCQLSFRATQVPSTVRVRLTFSAANAANGIHGFLFD